MWSFLLSQPCFLLESSELKLPMSVAAFLFCIWCKELLGPLLFLLKPWLNVHWHAGTWVPSFVYEFHVIQNLSLLLLQIVSLQLWVPCSGRTVRFLSWFTVWRHVLLLAQHKGQEWAAGGRKHQPKPACCWKFTYETTALEGKVCSVSRVPDLGCARLSLHLLLLLI